MTCLFFSLIFLVFWGVCVYFLHVRFSSQSNTVLLMLKCLLLLSTVSLTSPLIGILSFRLMEEEEDGMPPNSMWTSQLYVGPINPYYPPLMRPQNTYRNPNVYHAGSQNDVFYLFKKSLFGILLNLTNCIIATFFWIKYALQCIKKYWRLEASWRVIPGIFTLIFLTNSFVRPFSF